MKILKSSCLSDQYKRFLQWMTLFVYMSFLLTGALTGWAIWLYLVIYSSLLRYPMLLYVAWIYYDRNAGEFGNRRSKWVRTWKIWKYHNDFFPVKLHKTAELSSEKNYLLCVFPHGILSTGAFSAFGHDHGGFVETFPGLTSYMVTLQQHFHTPFIREYAMRVGALPASATCLNQYLASKKGVALALIVGGAHESLYCKPGIYTFNLSRRKGFIKIAYRNGTSLVPTLSFGEPDIFDQVQFAEDSFGRKCQLWWKKVTGIAPVLFFGQFSVVPYRMPLNVVVGKPIEVEKVEEPSQEQIDDLHAKFVEALRELFESEKHKYIENAENTHLTIL